MRVSLTFELSSDILIVTFRMISRSTKGDQADRQAMDRFRDHIRLCREQNDSVEENNESIQQTGGVQGKATRLEEKATHRRRQRPVGDFGDRAGDRAASKGR